ncbi:hypothetical protein AXF42_Ash012591 [Apostasia shenzhenica]|uniref:Uncharacterized protein n=1 Tax=Apostasia shenzhenica TaxID=1088818 RepID=A0A2H9ZT44_9ASPA|nr:hypothetical protein AXF42_Ash012591 [Apostasia shenzhenica]
MRMPAMATKEEGRRSHSAQHNRTRDRSCQQRPRKKEEEALAHNITELAIARAGDDRRRRKRSPSAQHNGTRDCECRRWARKKKEEEALAHNATQLAIAEEGDERERRRKKKP